jgi:hypothetical protein
MQTFSSLQGLSAHVSANSETLRSAFVDHEGKETITLRAGDYEGQLFDKSNPFDWKVGWTTWTPLTPS